ncbi:MAG: phosphoenolpyruvate carboxylase [Candidatus Marinimicrobia bacterium]|nr:phosphoenolpyruvate carboxylase [Candidatus Neomarinimicrobiota bacterium]MCF7828251.1 phosphoenolpyruvate carboxylase [Candidatus Neomarinimicrobiota bacterium]MCF7879574.1 phosphoenolpyruvate carboxylase [Candidatus Neomarinimicrobiota bacterium]
MVVNKELRNDINMLGEFLGTVIREQAGEDLFDLEEEIRQKAKDWRQGDHDALDEVNAIIQDLGYDDSLVIIKAFSIFFDLANLAEDVHRIRILREREQQHHPEPRTESIGEAIRKLRDSGLTSDQLGELFNTVTIKPVFTAHPTEAKRATVRKKLHRIREYINALHDRNLLAREEDEYYRKIQAEITSLWQTDLLHPRRPKVIDEVKWGLAFMDTLWEVVPRIFRDVDRAIDSTYPENTADPTQLLQFGSWIGGDRDGNPHVTAEVTEQTLVLHRDRAIRFHRTQCRELYQSLSTSAKQAGVSDDLRKAIEQATQSWPQLEKELQRVPDAESYRQWITIIDWRLGQAGTSEDLLDLPPGSYHRSTELVEDIELMISSLEKNQGHRLINGQLRDWQVRAKVFGLYLMRLDIREDAARFLGIVGEILEKSEGITGLPEMAEAEKLRVLREHPPDEIVLDQVDLSEDAEDIIRLFSRLKRVEEELGGEWIGNYIMSMTRDLSDILVILWLGRLSGLCTCTAEHAEECSFSIVPLFETVDDLHRAPEVLKKMFNDALYGAHLGAQDGQQTVMIGYSDSTKDGGYLSANWNLYRSQERMTDVANFNDIKLSIFHGRGGTLGRGGGPAARSILSLPPESVRYGLSMTEQGEILAERYGEPAIAHRHLEQILWASLLVERQKPHEEKGKGTQYIDILESLANRSYHAYKALINENGFLQYFGEATPISEVEKLPIGSRPAHRSAERTLENLRAIPWVFSWTQNRHFLPAWFGIGTGIEEETDRNPDLWDDLRHMYQEWPFFRAVINNAVLALKKTDLKIGVQYARLVRDHEVQSAVWNRITAEFRKSYDVLCRITDQENLLDNTPWLQRSINIRNPYVDPLNLLQVEWFRRQRGHSVHSRDYEDSTIEDALRYTIQGVASGLRSTG